jgi:hypothetical protein
MDHLMLWAWRVPGGEPRWAAAGVRVDTLPEEALLAAHAQLLAARPGWAEPGPPVIDQLRHMARRGLAELRRAYDGHEFAVPLGWPDGTLVLVVGASAAGLEPFDGWRELCLAATLGVPQWLGWTPAREPASLPRLSAAAPPPPWVEHSAVPAGVGERAA